MIVMINKISIKILINYNTAVYNFYSFNYSMDLVNLGSDNLIQNSVDQINNENITENRLNIECNLISLSI